MFLLLALPLNIVATEWQYVLIFVSLMFLSFT